MLDTKSCLRIIYIIYLLKIVIKFLYIILQSNKDTSDSIIYYLCYLFLTVLFIYYFYSDSIIYYLYIIYFSIPFFKIS